MHLMSGVLQLNWDFSFDDLYDRAGLARLDARFLEYLNSADAALAAQLAAARKNPPDRKENADLLVALAPHLEDFIGELFDVARDVRELQARHNALEPFYALKRKFIQKKAI